MQALIEHCTLCKASTYWTVLKNWMNEEDSDELLTNCKQLKLPAADSKNHKIVVPDLQQMLRITRSIPSK